MPAAQSAVLGEPQALLYVWKVASVEPSGRPVNSPTYQATMSWSRALQLVTFIDNICNKSNQNLPAASSEPFLHQEMPDQEMGEAIQQTQPESVHDALSSAQTVFESPELSSQTMTETAATAKPKKKASALTPARATRAKKRRQNDSIAKAVQPVIASKKQRNQLSRAKKVNPPSCRAAAPAAEKQNSPTMRSADYDEGEAIEAGIEAVEKSTICFPSRALDIMNKNKRKSRSEPVAMPSPEAGIYGLGATDVYGNSEEESITEEQPGKIRRTGEPGEIINQVGHPNTAQQFTGPNFQHLNTETKGGNIVAKYEVAIKVASISQQIPITNPTGSFKVPSPSDSDSSDSESEERERSSAGMAVITPSSSYGGEFVLANPGFGLSKLSKPVNIPRSAEPKALQKAREKLLQYKPRNPSKLSQSLRAYLSPSDPKEAEKR